MGNFKFIIALIGSSSPSKKVDTDVGHARWVDQQSLELVCHLILLFCYSKFENDFLLSIQHVLIHKPSPRAGVHGSAI